MNFKLINYSSLVLTWFLLCISSHEEVQKKMGREIEQVVGISRSPSLSDRKSTSYTEAVILETLRFGSVTSLGGPHRAVSDINYKEYLIKKDTTIIASLYGVNSDKDIWGDPENFRPERFLETEGMNVKNRPDAISFSDGKRKCLGERLARDELFLNFTGLIKMFSIFPEKEGLEVNFEGKTGLFMREPKPFEVFMKRKYT